MGLCRIGIICTSIEDIYT